MSLLLSLETDSNFDLLEDLLKIELSASENKKCGIDSRINESVCTICCSKLTTEADILSFLNKNLKHHFYYVSPLFPAGFLSLSLACGSLLSSHCMVGWSKRKTRKKE